MQPANKWSWVGPIRACAAVRAAAHESRFPQGRSGTPAPRRVGAAARVECPPLAFERLAGVIRAADLAGPVRGNLAGLAQDAVHAAGRKVGGVGEVLTDGQASALGPAGGDGQVLVAHPVT